MFCREFWQKTFSLVVFSIQLQQNTLIKFPLPMQNISDIIVAANMLKATFPFFEANLTIKSNLYRFVGYCRSII